MKFTKGNPELIEAAKAACVNPTCDFYGMDGDGIQAPGAIVVREVGGYSPFAVHFANTQCGGFHGGQYCKTLEEARSYAAKRAARYDPTGDLARSFKGMIPA